MSENCPRPSLKALIQFYKLDLNEKTKTTVYFFKTVKF